MLYLFGTPGPGAVLVHVGRAGRRRGRRDRPRRHPAADDCFASIDFFEQREIPFVVAVNVFDGARRYTVEEIRDALDVDPHVPVMLCDVRRRESARDVLVTLVEHAVRFSAPV